MKTVGIIFTVIGVIIALIVASFAADYIGLVKFGFFAPRYANVERQVFENTQSYVEGKRQEIVKYRLEYLKAKNANKLDDASAIRKTILDTTANLDKSKLEPSLQSFLSSLDSEETQSIK